MLLQRFMLYTHRSTLYTEHRLTRSYWMSSLRVFHVRTYSITSALIMKPMLISFPHCDVVPINYSCNHKHVHSHRILLENVCFYRTDVYISTVYMPYVYIPGVSTDFSLWIRVCIVNDSVTKPSLVTQTRNSKKLQTCQHDSSYILI